MQMERMCFGRAKRSGRPHTFVGSCPSETFDFLVDGNPEGQDCHKAFHEQSKVETETFLGQPF